MGYVSSPSTRSVILDVLARDTLVVIYLAVVVTEALLYSLPLMDPGTLTAFGASPFQIPFVATAMVAGFHRLRRVQDAEERMFWSHLAYACVFWVATLAAIAVVPASEWRLLDDVWADAAYLLFYSPILFAAECKPHLANLGGRRDIERQLRWAGVTLLVVGWYSYFVLVPVAVDPALFQTMLPSSLLFVTLDALIIIRFTWRAWSCGSTRWRVLYGTVAVAGAALVATDTLDLLEAVGVFALPDGAKTDLLWAIPPFLLLFAFRLREAELPRALDASTRERAADTGLDAVRVGSFLVGSALSFPIVHFALYLWLPFGYELERLHQVVVLVELILLASLAAYAFITLERQHVAAERRRTALEERGRQARTLEAVSRFAGVVADEYSASLRAIGAFADRALDELGSGDPLRDEVRRAAGQLHRAAEFASGLKAISRQQQGRPARLDLSDALSDLIPVVRAVVGAAVLIETVPSREPCVTVIDPAHLRALLLDLATNARDAMPRGGRWRLETGTVELDADAALEMAIQPGRYARLVVRDTGTGIPKDVLTHIFEPFYSTKPSDRGSGLGLATLYALVSQYGGCVNVTSEPGDTMCEILLPSPR
jgi:signal transduction histidine kinase